MTNLAIALLVVALAVMTIKWHLRWVPTSDRKVIEQAMRQSFPAIARGEKSFEIFGGILDRRCCNGPMIKVKVQKVGKSSWFDVDTYRICPRCRTIRNH